MSALLKQDYWACDVKISMPEAPDSNDAILVNMGAHGFTVNGLVHNISAATLEGYIHPTFGPESIDG